MPKISVIVPVYNVEDYLLQCLDSILAQDFEDYEIIIVDDETPDRSGEIAEEYAKKYPEKIKVIHQKNKGLGGARNSGIEVAKGEYLVFVDSDDTIEPDMLSILYNEIESTGAEIAVCGLNNVWSGGKVLQIKTQCNKYHTFLDVGNNKNLIFNTGNAACNKIIKRALFVNPEIRFPERVWYEDLRTTTKLIAIAKGIVFTDKCLYNYMQRDGSIMRNDNLDRNREIIDAANDILSYYKENKLFDVYSTELEYLILREVYFEVCYRLLPVTYKSSIFNDMYNYITDVFPNSFNNPYFLEQVNNESLKRRIIIYFLKNKRYKAVHNIFCISRKLSGKVY